MTLSKLAILAAYFFVLSILAFYGWHRYYLVYWYKRYRATTCRGRVPPLDPLPVVTIQLPIFNEMYVVDRLIDAVCEIDYPREQLEIQVLDDSTDETVGCGRAGRPSLGGAGLRHLVPPPHRPHRLQGRGARGRAATCAKGEFIAIFDADFVPPPDFLRRTLPHFTDPQVGMVQARWGHLNRDYSTADPGPGDPARRPLRPRARRRNRAGRFFNFNGTAGIWRRDAIERRGRLAARHAHRGSRPELPRPAARLALRLPARRRRAGRAAGRDERVQDPAAPLGQGLDPDGASSSCRRFSAPTCRSGSRSRRSSTSRPTSTTC